MHVERCKYLEESKCVGICINTCKFPTQVSDSSNYYHFLFMSFLCLNPPVLMGRDSGNLEFDEGNKILANFCFSQDSNTDSSKLSVFN